MSSEWAGTPLRDRLAVAVLRLLPENGGEDIDHVVERLMIIMESSEQAGTPTRDEALDGIAQAVRNWRESKTTHDEVGTTDFIEDIKWFLDRVGQVGTPTHGALNPAVILDAIRECAAPGMELQYDGTENPVAAAYVAGVHTAYETAKGALEACVVTDPRLARIEALHRPEDGGMGYHDDGHYGSFDGPVCSTCGTADEYGVRWPCPTIQILQGDHG